MNFKPIAVLLLTCLLFPGVGKIQARPDDASDGLNSFAFDLYRETKSGRENLFLSPLSSYYSLLTACEGSKSQTREEFEKVLYFRDSDSPGNHCLLPAAGTPDCYSGLTVSNAIWVDKSLTINGPYVQAVSDKYSSDVKLVNFKEVPSAVADINQWVTEKTNRQLTGMVSEANVQPDTKLLISSVVYFKGEWKEKFEKRMTHTATFFTGPEDQYTVDLMEKKEILRYFEDEEFQFISKPYQASGLSFCILLPKKLFGIEEMEKKLCSDFLNRILDSTRYEKTLLSLPRFAMESDLDLSQALQNAGLTSAFIPSADFSGITHEKPVMLGQVLHKTRIELDEEKTEAAAATALNISIGSASLDAFRVFKADHPFVFFIFDNSSRSIVFMGRYVRPVQGLKSEEDQKSLSARAEHRQSEAFYKGDKTREILYVVNNKPVSRKEFEAIDPGEIQAIEVFKDTKEVRKYTSGDFGGVLKVTLKKTGKE